MDILVAATLLIAAVAIFVQKPVKIEITHKHVLDTPEEQRLKDPNETEKVAADVEKTMNAVIQNLNHIMNGGEDPNERR